jgi:hypothetical protein
MKHSTGKPTKLEQLRLDRIHAMSCCACLQGMLPQPFPTEAHHLVDKGYRIHSGGHIATIPLCKWHHRGELLYPHTSREMFQLYGPSLATRKRDFVAQFGTERELLELTNQRLEQAA